MPVIEPVPFEHLDAELQELIRAGRAAGMLSTTIPNQIWAYKPTKTDDMPPIEQMIVCCGRNNKGELTSLFGLVRSLDDPPQAPGSKRKAPRRS